MAAIDLCTLSDVRQFLQKESGLTSTDPLLESLITKYSQLIVNYTNRQLSPTESDVSHTFEVTGNYVDLAPYDLATLNTITLDGNTVSSDHYRLYPRNQEFGVYTHLELSSQALAGATPGNFGSVDLVINGDWGFPEVPEDVKHWAIIAVVVGYRADAAAFSTSFSIDEDRLTRPESLPSAVRSGLSRYKRMRVG